VLHVLTEPSPLQFRYYTFPDPSLSISKSGDTLMISVEAPLRGLKISAVGEGPEVKWSDNAFDLWPGHVEEVVAEGLGSRKLSVQYLGSEHGTEIAV